MIYLKLITIYIIILLIIIFISRKLELVDNPNNRKLHKIKTLNTSGVAFYLYLLIIVSTFELIPKLEEVIILGSFIVICGFIDDRFALSPAVKLFLTFIPVYYLIEGGLIIENLGIYEYIGALKLGKFSFIFTILGCALIMHSYNYIDGVDGLLIIITITNILFGIFLIKQINYELVQLLSFLLIPLTVNFIFNFFKTNNPFKIFMGDSGSLFVGFFISFFVIYLHLYEKIHPSLLIWLCWYPIYDFLFVTIYRIIKKKKFYMPDKTHFHHMLMNMFNKSHIKTTLIIFLINALISIFGYIIFYKLGSIYSLISFVSLFLAQFFIRINLIKKFPMLIK